jgi:hypothetical protein
MVQGPLAVMVGVVPALEVVATTKVERYVALLGAPVKVTRLHSLTNSSRLILEVIPNGPDPLRQQGKRSLTLGKNAVFQICGWRPDDRGTSQSCPKSPALLALQVHHSARSQNSIPPCPKTDVIRPGNLSTLLKFGNFEVVGALCRHTARAAASPAPFPD